MTRVSKPNSWQYQSGFARTELNHIVYPDDNSLRYDQQNPSSWAPSQVRLVVLIGETCAAKLQDNRRSSTAKKGILEHFDAPVADLRATTKVRTSWLDSRLAVGPADTCHPIIVTTYIINVSSGISLAAALTYNNESPDLLMDRLPVDAHSDLTARHTTVCSSRFRPEHHEDAPNSEELPFPERILWE